MERQEAGFASGETSKRVVLDPISQIHVGNGWFPLHRNGQVHGVVSVSEEAGCQIGVGLCCRFASVPNPFRFRMGKIRQGFLFGATSSRPAHREPNAPIRVHPTEGALEERRSEDALQPLVAVITRAEAVSVPNQHAVFADLEGGGFPVEGDPELFFEVTKGPQVVVAYVVVHGNARIREASDGPHQPCTAFGNRMPVFEPKVKQVPYQVDFSGRTTFRTTHTFRNLSQPAHQVPFPCSASRRIRRAEVQIRREVDARFWSQRQAIKGTIGPIGPSRHDRVSCVQ